MKYAIFFVAVAGWAQLQPPQLGVMIDRQGVARPVTGVASSVTAGDPLAQMVTSSACSGELCLFKTRASLVIGETRLPAPSGPALFALNETLAYVYFSKNRQLARWSNGSLTQIETPVTGEVLSIAMVQGALQFAVLRDGGIWIVDQDNQTLGSIPGSGPAMLIADGFLYAAEDFAILRRNEGSELRWPLAGIQGFSALGDGYVQIRTNTASYALRVDKFREQLFMLPEIAP